MNSDSNHHVRSQPPSARLHPGGQAIRTPDRYPGPTFQQLLLTLKLLRIESKPYSQLFGVICALPKLDDLSISSSRLVGYGNHDRPVLKASKSPRFRGTINLSLPHLMKYVTGNLLGLQNGSHFRRFKCKWWDRKPDHTISLIKKYSNTLQSIGLEWVTQRAFLTLLGRAAPNSNLGLMLDVLNSSIELRQAWAPKLKEVAFRIDVDRPQWMLMAFRTIEHKHLKVLIHTKVYPGQIALGIEREVGKFWEDIDHILSELGPGVRTRVIYDSEAEHEVYKWIRGLLRSMGSKVKVGKEC